MILSLSSSSLAFNVYVNPFCKFSDKSFNFDANSYSPDFIVRISKYLSNPDFTVKVINNKFLADIVVQDNQDNQHYSICKSKDGNKIKISNSLLDVDLSIKISNYSLDPDLTIYTNSKIFSIEKIVSSIVSQRFTNLPITSR